MAKIIQVTPELLESTAGKIEGLAGDYKTQYDQLYSETNAMASTWNGKDLSLIHISEPTRRS